MNSNFKIIRNCFLALISFSELYSYGQITDTVFQKKLNTGSWNHQSKLLSLGLGDPILSPFYFYQPAEVSAQTSTLSNFNNVPVLHIKCEFAISYHLGLGVCFNRSDLYFNTSINVQHGNNPPTIETDLIHQWVTTINFRANYHFLHAKILDPYVGLGTGFRRIREDTRDGRITLTEPRARFGFEATCGMRVLIKSRIGIYAELGFGRSLAQVGISLNWN